MEKLRFWECVGYGLFCIAGLGVVVGIGRAYGLDADDWAAWVQAFGSIFAIGVAILVMRWQNEAAMRLFRLERLAAKDDRLHAATALAMHVHRVSMEIINCFKDRSTATDYLLEDPSVGGFTPDNYLLEKPDSDIAKLIDVLATISPLELQSFAAVAAIMELQIGLRRLDVFIKGLKLDPYFHRVEYDDVVETTRKIESSIIRATRDLIMELDEVANDLKKV